MNKVFKVIWNEARNAYVVVSEIAKNHGSKSSSTKKLLAMLIATGVMTCASFDVLAAEPSGTDTAKSQYVAFADPTHTLYSGNKTTIDGYEYIYDATNKYWVRKGYKLVVEENGAMHTPLSDHGKSSDVAYIGNGDKDSILQSVASMVSASGTVTNMGESLNKITASGFVGVSHSGGTAVDGTWHYIIHDPTWEGAVAQGNYKDGYVDLVGKNMPKGFVTADDNKGLIWDDDKQAYNYKGKPVDYSNVYVIDGKIGVFTNKDGSDFYEGTVFGKNNEILMTVKDDSGHFYSYWASAVTDPSATMSTYRLAEYKKDLSVLVENDEKLSRNDIKEVTLDTTQANSATIGLLRNGDTEAGAPVKGAITVTSGGGTDGSGAANDTFVKISNGTANQTFATGSKVEVNGPANAITGIKVNGVDYTIKQGSGVKVEQDATKKTTTITVDGTATTITDNDTTYTAGDGIEISSANAISVSKNLIGMESIQGAGEGKISFDGDNVKVNNTTFGENSVVVGVAGDGKHPVRIDGETGRITGLANTKVGYTDFANDKGTAATEGQLKQVMDEGWKFTTDSNEKTTVKVGPDGTNDNAVTFKGDGTNIAVTNTGKDIKVALKKDLTVDSVKAGDFFMDKNKGVGYVDKAYITSSGLNANNQKITGVSDGTNDTDAVNFGQLDATNKKVDNLTTEVGKGWTVAADNGTATKVGAGDTVKFSGADNNIKVSNDGTNVKVELNKDLTGLNSVTTNNAYVTNVDASKGSSVTNVEYVKNQITDAALSAGNGISITDKKINVKLKDGEQNLVVDSNGLSLSTALTGIQSITGVGTGAGSISFADGAIKLNNKVTIDNTGKITGVAAGTADTDAVNVSQLNNVKAEAGKHTTLVAGENVTLDKKETDKGLEYTVNAVDTKYTAGNGITIDAAANNAISVNLKEGEVNLAVDEKGLSLNKGLKGIESVSNGAAKLELSSNPIFGATAKLTNGKASVELRDSTTIINGKVQVRQDGSIGGVTAGRVDNDAVNLGQLKDVKAEAGKHTTLVAGDNVQVKEEKTDNGLKYTVSATDTTYTAGNGIAINGENNAISVKLKAGEGNLVVDKDGLALNKDLQGIASISNGDAKLTLGAMGGMVSEFANGQGASVKLFGDTTTINGKVNVYKDGRIAGVADGVNATDAVNVSQLQKVSDTANAGWNLSTNGVTTEATNVKPGETVDFSGDKNISVSNDGTKVKVELNKDLDVNSVQTNALNSKYNLSVGTMAENGIMPFFVNSTGAFYAASNKFSVDKDGNMNANSVQTNALNSKYNLSVGTANENGTVPFFVNSNGAFYAANGKLVVDKDGKLVAPEAELGKVTADEGVIGNVVLKDGVFYKHTALRDGELFVGDASGNYSQITTKGAKLGKVTIAEDGKISGVAAGEVSSTSTDAINGSQLHQTNENVAALDKRVTQNEADIATNKANIAQNAADIAANKANIAQNAADIATNKANIAQNAADIAQNKADIAQNKADIAQNKADIAQNKTDIKNLDNRVTNVEELAKKHTTVTAGDNITVTEDTNKDGGKEYKVALDKDIKLDSVTTGQTVMNNDGLKVGDKVSVTKDAVTAGKTSISDEGVKVGDKTYISDNGLNANNKVITNVADGKENSDAVNYGQLKGVENQVISNTNRINQLGSRVNKVGAGAAALAALHPMDFDPDDKLTFSAGYGNYGGENAAAIGAYYRPDEKVMFSVGGTVGNGENMVNAGVSFSLDRTNHVSNSRTAMAREILDLRAEVTELKAMVAKGGLGSIAEDKMKIFPDVAENHWAYEYVGKLAAAGIIEGYPDGKFSGDRMMSRYEFAAMLYRAMQKGAQLDSKIINEFAPEMGRIRVDRISGEDGDRDKIERVRVNAVKGERDHYGNKIAKAEAKAK